MAFFWNNNQTRTSSYHSSTAFDPEESFQKHHPKKHNRGDESNPWKVNEEDELTYHHRSPYECSVEPHQESIPLTFKNLDGIKLETWKEKWDRFFYWLKQSWNAPPPPDSDMKPPSNDWNRKILVPKLRIAPHRSVAESDWNQHCRKESKRSTFWNNEINEIPVPVRSPSWTGNYRKSAGQKRKRHNEEGHMQSNGQNPGWQSMQSYIVQDRQVQSFNEDDNGLQCTRYVESVYESCINAYGPSSTQVNRQARFKRFHRDQDFVQFRNSTQNELNCSLDDIITERFQTRKLMKTVPQHSKMYGSVAPALPMHSFPPKLEMKPYNHGGARSPVQGQRRPIIIDGSNVAYGKSLGKYFDSDGICICVNWFLEKGFTDIVVVVSEHRLSKSGCRNPEPLWKLKRENKLITCWSRKLPNGRWVTSYDDRMIVEIAHKRGGIIISNDRFRDLRKEKPEWAETIGTRVVGFRFMPGKMDEIMFPDDPLGRDGPRLDELLRF